MMMKTRYLSAIIATLALIFTAGCTLVISTKPEPATSAETSRAAAVALDTATPEPSATPAPTETDTPQPDTPTPQPTRTASPAPSATGTTAPTPTTDPRPAAERIALTQTAQAAANPPATATEPPATAPALSTSTPQATSSATSTPTATPTTPPDVPSPTPQPTPTPRPTATPAPAPAPATGPRVYESTITIPTYDYQSALVDTSPDDPVYPYPRLDRSRMGAPIPTSYRAIILENDYTQLTILPELGGRIYKWIDKISGKNLFYENPVIKPTEWGHRGWWLATGGMEWALPVDEHGLSEASVWEVQYHQGNGQASVLVSDTEEHSGLMSEVIISLDAEHAWFSLTPRIFNPTDHPIDYKFWLNGMFSLGQNSIGTGLDFVLPTRNVTVHSTADETLPDDGEVISWPVYNGRDFSRYENWQDYLGIFAAPKAAAGYMGAYNHTTNLGVVRIFPFELAQGAKIFAPGNLPPSLWTDDDSSYFELWGGLAPTFWDSVTLQPGAWVVWQEKWYAVGDMGGFSFATEEAALNLGLTDKSVQVAAAATHFIDGDLVLSNAGQEVTRWPVTISPRAPFRGSFTPSAGDPHGGDWSLRLVDSGGKMLASTGDTAPSAAASVPLPTATATAQATSIAVQPTAIPSPTPAPVATAPAGVVWDSRLSELGITLSTAQGQPRFKLIEAKYWDDQESKLLHHIFVEVLDEQGNRLLNQPVVMAWDDGQATAYTEDKPAPEYAANFPMYETLGKYSVHIDGAASDTVSGMGLPAKHHVSYLLTFQRVR